MGYIGQFPSAAVLTGDQIPDNVITSTKIADGTVVAADIGDTSVTTAKLAANAVTSAKIAVDAIDTGQIVDAAITSDKLNTLSNIDVTGGNITNANIFDIGLKVSQISSSSNAITLNYETATVFVCNATENANITLTNFPESGVALLKLTYGGNYTIGYAGNAKFATGTAPTLTAAGLDYLYFEGNVNGYLVTSVLDIQGA